VPLLSSDFASGGSRTQTRVSEYQPEIGRSIDLCTGSALGGTSRINQMIYLRGLEKEYDMWKEVQRRAGGKKRSEIPGESFGVVSFSFLILRTEQGGLRLVLKLLKPDIMDSSNRSLPVD
jgi:hypothetical protein